MFIELVDALRCPRPHEESWLVLSALEIDARHVRHGTLGCPVCSAEYPIVDGVADFRGDAERDVTPALTTTTLVPADHLAAMMNLADAQGFAVLVGGWGQRADELVEMGDVPPLMLIDPPRGVEMRAGLSGVRCGTELPLAAGAARAVAVDTISIERIRSAARATRVGGRVVAPAEASLPDGVRELARDERVWVGSREAMPSVPIMLHVRRG
ncbi:MAG: hypothetical protein ABI601_20625 [bacterium]